MLCLFYLSAAFDTIDHDYILCILEKYVGICGNALKLIRSYFSNRTLLQIDGVLSDLANIICGVPPIGFRNFKMLFVLIANERNFEVS